MRPRQSLQNSSTRFDCFTFFVLLSLLLYCKMLCIQTEERAQQARQLESSNKEMEQMLQLLQSSNTPRGSRPPLPLPPASRPAGEEGEAKKPAVPSLSLGMLGGSGNQSRVDSCDSIGSLDPDAPPDSESPESGVDSDMKAAIMRKTYLQQVLCVACGWFSIPSVYLSCTNYKSGCNYVLVCFQGH